MWFARRKGNKAVVGNKKKKKGLTLLTTGSLLLGHRPSSSFKNYYANVYRKNKINCDILNCVSISKRLNIFMICSNFYINQTKKKKKQIYHSPNFKGLFILLWSSNNPGRSKAKIIRVFVLYCCWSIWCILTKFVTNVFIYFRKIWCLTHLCIYSNIIDGFKMKCI